MASKTLESVGWIPITKSLPKIGERVLTFVPKADNKITILRLGPDDPDDGGSQWLEDDDDDDVVGFVLGAVTHWMPLPSEPKDTNE